ncbi:AAA family ATPase [Acidipropionibacterium thoenii]|uniref:AAA family ATPase n=1 Tax=Acidipropionibacterium thoenii TaxID=1751 RepID=UPI00042203DF|nr:AAA family ATPase [Acidipropionibacterium thoenii]
MRQFRHGLVLGKFYPFHAGHEHLICAAAARCQQVTVQVLGSRQESIPLEVRRDWVAGRFPMLDVVAAMDEAEVDFDSPAAWDQHMEVIEPLLETPVDAVFSSDGYGAELARRLDAQWVRIDPGRASLPTSGTAVRADPAGHWWALSPQVRQWFCRRVVVLGAESTGSTTLARALAGYYRTRWVPEYGRTWSQIRPGGLEAPWHTAEFDLIAAEHLRQERDAMATAPIPLVISDTDVLATSIWHERYLGVSSPSVTELASRWRPDLYLLTGDEIPFVQDGLRDGERLRHGMQQRFRDVLADQQVAWAEVAGGLEERVRISVDLIDAVMAGGWQPADPLGWSIRSPAPPA